MWQEVYEYLQGVEYTLGIPKIWGTENELQPWTLAWDKSTENMVTKKHAWNWACINLVKYFVSVKAVYDQRTFIRHWGSNNATDIYLVAALLKIRV